MAPTVPEIASKIIHKGPVRIALYHSDVLIEIDIHYSITIGLQNEIISWKYLPFLINHISLCKSHVEFENLFQFHFRFSSSQSYQVLAQLKSKHNSSGHQSWVLHAHVIYPKQCWAGLPHVDTLTWCSPDSKIHGPIWDPPGSDRTQVGPMWASWKLLSGPSMRTGWNFEGQNIWGY